MQKIIKITDFTYLKYLMHLHILTRLTNTEFFVNMYAHKKIVKLCTSILVEVSNLDTEKVPVVAKTTVVARANLATLNSPPSLRFVAGLR